MLGAIVEWKFPFCFEFKKIIAPCIPRVDFSSDRAITDIMTSTLDTACMDTSPGNELKAAVEIKLFSELVHRQFDIDKNKPLASQVAVMDKVAEAVFTNRQGLSANIINEERMSIWRSEHLLEQFLDKAYSTDASRFIAVGKYLDSHMDNLDDILSAKVHSRYILPRKLRSDLLQFVPFFLSGPSDDRSEIRRPSARPF